MRHAEGLLTGESAEGVASHLASCQDCRDKASSMRAFAGRLNTQWLAAHIRTIIPEAWGCSSTEELGRYFLDEAGPAERERVRLHLEGCLRCQDILTEMEGGAATLMHADPLEVREAVQGGSWWGRLRASIGLIPTPAWMGATVAVSLAFVAGLLLRPILMGPSPPRRGLETYRIVKPLFTPPAEVPAFGVAPSVKPEADQRFREAMVFYPDRDFPDKAIPKLKEAVSAGPRHDQAEFWLGVAYLLKGEVVAAIPPLEEAVKLAPGKSEYKRYLVWAYLKSGQPEKALRVQSEILQKP